MWPKWPLWDHDLWPRIKLFFCVSLPQLELCQWCDYEAALDNNLIGQYYSILKEISYMDLCFVKGWMGNVSIRLSSITLGAMSLSFIALFLVMWLVRWMDLDEFVNSMHIVHLLSDGHEEDNFGRENKLTMDCKNHAQKEST